MMESLVVCTADKSLEEVLKTHGIEGLPAEVRQVIQTLRVPDGSNKVIEARRQVLPTEPQRIDTSRILISVKQSKLDWDMATLGASRNSVIASYRREGVDIEKIMASHNAQKRVVNQLSAYFAPEQILERNQLTTEKLANYDLVIAVGGDDHFKYVSHFVKDKFIIGLNSDPARSEGAITSIRIEDLPRLLSKLEQGEFLVEEWPRLEVEVNGQLLPPACSEIHIGDADSEMTSRSRIEINSNGFSAKGSGVLIATGAGSTGWYKSAGRYIFPLGNTWARTTPQAAFLVREPYDGRLSNHDVLTGEFGPRDELVVKSSHNHSGVVSSDSLERLPFPRGHAAKIRFSRWPLKVVV